MKRGFHFLSLFALLALSPAADAATWTVGQSGNEDFADFGEACAAASAGDSILVSPGYYGGVDEWIMLESKPLKVFGLGANPDDTALHVRLSLTDCDGMLIENVCVCGPLARIGCRGPNGRTILRHCAVRDADNYAVRVIEGELLVEDCVFSGNSTNQVGGALSGVFTVRRSLFVENSAAYYGGAVDAEWGSVIEDCVFFRNEAPSGAAVSLFSGVDLRNCTFLGNRVTGPNGGALAVLDTEYDWISHCIIAGTENGYGVECPGSGSLLCCDLWDNDLGGTWGEWFCDALPQYGNFSEDPLFCDPLTGDVGLLEGSPCLPGNHGGMECDLIGAKGLGCGQVPVRETTWGRLKMGYR